MKMANMLLICVAAVAFAKGTLSNLPVTTTILSADNFGTITDIQYVSGQQNVVAGQGQQHTMIRIYFTVSAAQAAADGGNVNLAWGGHIGRALDWGSGNSAGGISGSPYHMNLHGFCAGTTPNDGTLCTDGGSQERSLSAQAVSAPGTIQIIKNIQQPGIEQLVHRLPRKLFP